MPVSDWRRYPKLEIEIYTRAAAALAADPGVDAVLVAGRGMTPELNRLYTQGLIQALRESGKPFVAVNVLGFDGDFARELCSAGIPFFNTVERAAATYAHKGKPVQCMQEAKEKNKLKIGNEE